MIANNPYITNTIAVLNPEHWTKEAGILGLVICSLVFIILQFIHHLHKKDKTFVDTLEKKDQFFVQSIQDQRLDARSYIDKLLESNLNDREVERKLNQDIHDRLAKVIQNLTHELERKR